MEPMPAPSGIALISQPEPAEAKIEVSDYSTATGTQDLNRSEAQLHPHTPTPPHLVDHASARPSLLQPLPPNEVLTEKAAISAVNTSTDLPCAYCCEVANHPLDHCPELAKWTPDVYYLTSDGIFVTRNRCVHIHGPDGRPGAGLNTIPDQSQHLRQSIDAYSALSYNQKKRQPAIGYFIGAWYVPFDPDMPAPAKQWAERGYICEHGEGSPFKYHRRPYATLAFVQRDRLAAEDRKVLGKRRGFVSEGVKDRQRNRPRFE